MTRTKLLSIGVAAMLMLGVMFALYPFIASWSPNSKSEGRVLEVDINEIPSGSSKLIEWDFKPIIIYRPSTETAKYLVSINDVANGPDFTLENMPNYFVYVAVSTHLGCGLLETESFHGYNGFFDPCHRGFWDHAGRLIPSVHSGQGLDDLLVFSGYRVVSENVIHFVY